MEIDLIRILSLFWVRRYFIFTVVVLAGALGLGTTFFLPPGYTAKTEFLMQA